MATVPLTRFLKGLRDAGVSCSTPSDGELLGAFIAGRDEGAFEALVRRHGPMVLSVCRRVLGAVHDAEDAFQATFLVLARKARSIRQRQTLGSWLYSVAYRTALQAHRVRSRRHAREKQVNDMPQPSVDPNENVADWQLLLDRALSELPDKHRLPIVLCDLERRSRKEVATQLRIPEGTLSNRLTAARRMLARRLVRHGLFLSSAAMATLLAQQSATAALSPVLVGSTVEAAHAIAAGAAVAVSAQVTTLTEGVLKVMLLNKLKNALVIIFTIGLLTLGGGRLARHTAAGQPEQPIDPTPVAAGEAPVPAQKVDSVPGKEQKGGKQIKDFQQKIDDALNRLKDAKDQKGEKEAFTELLKAVAELKDSLHEKWGLPIAGKEPPPPKITAEKLVDVFQANQADGDQRFGYKVIEVTGKLDKVFRAPKGFEHQKGVPDYVVEMSDGKDPTKIPLQFLFAEAMKKELSSLKPGQTITIQAFCRGLVPTHITPTEGMAKGPSIHHWSCKIISAEK